MRVAFVQRSDVVAGGVRHERWKVHWRGTWLSPEACLSHLDGSRRDSDHLSAGCQYWHEVELELPAGTEVEWSRSQPIDRRGDSIDDFLRNPGRERRRTTRTRYRVMANGKLVRIDSK